MGNVTDLHEVMSRFSLHPTPLGDPAIESTYSSALYPQYLHIERRVLTPMEGFLALYPTRQ